jgi:hypothetical protein
VDCQRARSLPSAEPVAHSLALDDERDACASFVWWPVALGGEWAVGDTYRREIQDGAEVEGDAGSARVVSAGAVDQEDAGRVPQRAHGGFQ